MSKEFEGAKLKRKRTECGLTQKELAGAVAVSSASIGRYERNRRTPDSNTLMRIVRKLKCQCDDLFS